MKNTSTKVFLAVFLAVPVFSLFASAESVVDQAESALVNPSGTFDGSRSRSGISPAFKADISNANTRSAVKGDEPPSEPEKPGFFKTAANDIKKNKMGYLTIVGMAALFGLIFFGTGGAALIAAGAVFGFTVLTRMNFYGVL